MDGVKCMDGVFRDGRSKAYGRSFPRRTEFSETDGVLRNRRSRRSGEDLASALMLRPHYSDQDCLRISEDGVKRQSKSYILTFITLKN